MIDFANCMRDLVDVHFPDAETIVVVMDNLNTHKMGALYQAFEPAEARRIMEKIEIHYTPKHGSCLNMAEIELSVLHRQCLKARILTNRPWSNKLRHGKMIVIANSVPSIGNLQPMMLVFGFTVYIRYYIFDRLLGHSALPE